MDIRLWYEEGGRDYLGLGAVVVFVLTVVLLYFFGAISEQVVGLGIALLALLGAGGFALVRFLREGESGAMRTVGGVVSVIAALLGTVMVATSLIPGKPLASGELLQEGDSLTLPSGAPRTVRLLLHGSVRGLGNADVVLAVDEVRLEGHFSKDQRQGRVGRRTRGPIASEHSSEFLSASLTHPARRVQLRSLRGQLDGPLQVRVFSDPLPAPWAWGVGGALFFLATLLAARRSEVTAAAGAVGGIVIFGIMTHQLATPESAVRAEFGALILALIVAGVLSALFPWLFRRLFWREQVAVSKR